MRNALGVFPAKGGISPAATILAVIFQLGFDRESEQPLQQVICVLTSRTINGMVTKYDKPAFLKSGEQLTKKAFSILFEISHAESFNCVAHGYCTIMNRPLPRLIGTQV